MEISKYVIETISSINTSRLRYNFEAERTLRAAAETAGNNHDAYVLELISDVLSMSYSTNNHTFSPRAIFEERRSFSMEDIHQEDSKILESVVAKTDNVWVRTRLSHVVWILSNNYLQGQTAVTGYLQLFEETFDPEHWMDCHDAIQCACHIASLLGKKSAALKQTYTVINCKLSAMAGTDPLFLSLRLLNLVIKDATQQTLESYLPIISRLASKNICADNNNPLLADETFSVQEQLLKRLNRLDDIKLATAKYASYYETYAASLEINADYHRAVIALKKSCTLYGAIKHDRLLDVRSQLERLQKKALKQMQAIPFEIEADSIRKSVEQLFLGLSLEESIVQIGRVATVYKIEDVKQQIFKKKKDYVFSSMFSSRILNEDGQTVQKLPALRETDANKNSDALFKHMVHHVSEQRRQIESIALGYALNFLNAAGTITAESLDFLISNNAIIPANREEIIKEGLYCGLNGNLYAAMHILLPQTENIFRALVKMCGDTVTFLKEDGTESYKPLSALFKSSKLLECYNEDIIFTFQSIMDDPAGENLRNLNAHGLLEPQNRTNSSAICFLCLLIKLLIMYSPKAQPILQKLAER